MSVRLGAMSMRSLLAVVCCLLLSLASSARAAPTPDDGFPARLTTSHAIPGTTDALRSASSANANASANAAPIPRRWLVVFKTEPSALTAGSTGAAAHANRLRLNPQALIAGHINSETDAVREVSPHSHRVRMSATLSEAQVQAALTALRTEPTVALVEEDRRVKHHGVVPNDVSYSERAYTSTQPVGQWHLKANRGEIKSAINAEAAWSYSQGASSVVIAVLDTGVLYGHPDLKRLTEGGRLLPGYDFVSSDGNGEFLAANDGSGWDNDPSDPGDWVDAALLKAHPGSLASCSTQNSSWHGTRTAGLIGALTQNGTGIAAVDWNARLLPVRVLGRCGGFTSDIIAGIRWAAGLHVVGVPDNPHPAKVINLSLGGEGACSASEQAAIDEVTSRGVLVVASAGNEQGPVGAPGNCRGVLAVGGLRHIGTKVGFSSFGPEVGISAPGGNCVNVGAGEPCLYSIDTTTNDGTTVPANHGYTTQLVSNVGTSFSAPLASGVAGLMLGVNPSLTPGRLIAALKTSATPFPSDPTLPVCPALSDGKDTTGQCNCTTTQCGAGMLNAVAAVQAVNPAECLFTWVERALPQFVPTSPSTELFGAYQYRHYPAANAYLGIGADSGRVFYLGAAGLVDLGSAFERFSQASCL